MDAQSKIYEIVKKENPDNPLSFVLNAVKPLAIEKLNNAIKTCEDCKISCNSVKSLTKGNPNASILIIGDFITEEQNVRKKDCVPFDDYAGESLYSILDYYNVNRNQLFFINSVNCFPTSDNIPRCPTVAERHRCKTFLDYAIEIVKPLMIICLGAVAINGINEEIGRQKLCDIRGNFFQYRGMDVMPTYSPSYFIEANNNVTKDILDVEFNEFCSDLEIAFTTFQEKYPNIPIFNS